MPVSYARDSIGRFASTEQEVGKSVRKGENRRDLKRRLRSKVGGGKVRNRSLHGSISKRVVSKQEKKSRARYMRRLRKNRIK